VRSLVSPHELNGLELVGVPSDNSLGADLATTCRLRSPSAVAGCISERCRRVPPRQTYPDNRTIAAMRTMRQVSREPVKLDPLGEGWVAPPGTTCRAVECDDRGRGDPTPSGGIISRYGADWFPEALHDCYADFPSPVESKKYRAGRCSFRRHHLAPRCAPCRIPDPGPAVAAARRVDRKTPAADAGHITIQLKDFPRRSESDRRNTAHSDKRNFRLSWHSSSGQHFLWDTSVLLFIISDCFPPLLTTLLQTEWLILLLRGD